MKVRMLDKKIAVESRLKVKKQSGGLLHIPESNDCMGVVKYVAEDVTKVKIGDVVVYGDTRQRIKMLGEDVEIMEYDNIFAVLEETDGETKETSA